MYHLFFSTYMKTHSEEKNIDCNRCQKESLEHEL